MSAPAELHENDNENWYSANVGVQGYFHLHLSASDYETVMYALACASDYLDYADSADDLFSQLRWELMDWNHCDDYPLIEKE